MHRVRLIAAQPEVDVSNSEALGYARQLYGRLFTGLGIELWLVIEEGKMASRRLKLSGWLGVVGGRGWVHVSVVGQRRG